MKKNLPVRLLALAMLAVICLSIGFEVRHHTRPYDMPPGSPSLISPSHEAYMQPLADGRFHPEDVLCRGEACQILYELLQNPIPGHCDFADVPEDSPYYRALACLCSWGMVSNSRGDFHPENPLTRAQLMSILSSLYPPLEAETEFTDIRGHWAEAAIENAAARNWVDGEGRFRPDEAVTRAEFCQILNRVLGRRCDEAALLLGGGYAHFADVPTNHPAFGDVMEAAYTHSHSLSAEGEAWPMPALNPGFHSVYGRLYYITDDGRLLKDSQMGLFHFGPDGRITCGDAEVDALVEEFLLDCTDESMSREQKLRAAYLSIKYDYGYGPFPPGLEEVNCGDRDFEVPWARSFFKTGGGNCVAYASALCLAARALGYEAQAVFGLFNYYRDDHSWVIIPENGVDYIYDPEQELARDEWMDDFDLYKAPNGDPLEYHYEEFYP